jgi:hypothetical protein
MTTLQEKFHQISQWAKKIIVLREQNELLEDVIKEKRIKVQ